MKRSGITVVCLRQPDKQVKSLAGQGTGRIIRRGAGGAVVNSVGGGSLNRKGIGTESDPLRRDKLRQCRGRQTIKSVYALLV